MLIQPARLNNLRDQIHKIQGQQNQLLQVQTVALHQIDELEGLMKEIIHELHYSKYIVARYWALDQVQEQIGFNIQKLIQALPAGHQC